MGASSPDDAGGHVPVGLERGERQVGLPDVPHVDGEVHHQRRAADVLSSLRPPFHLKKNKNNVKSQFYLKHLNEARSSVDGATYPR